jgi:putative restriction endonuclease
MSFQLLVDRFVRDLERCGATVGVRPVSGKPAHVRVVAHDRTTDCLVFLWNITPGGGRSNSRPRSERRIQVTATERFPLRVGMRTIIGGWCDETESWGFWGVMRHAQFSRNSPSFQMRVETLEAGFNGGVSTQARSTTPPEIVVSVSGDFLLWYVQDGAILHNSGTDGVEALQLLDADPETERQFLDSVTDEEGHAERRYRLVETIQAVRDARFRPQVLRAYSHRCAICEVSLNLVDAAHIIPVRRPGSTDDVTNGIALCKLHHAAFDSGLVGVKSDYSIVVNPAAVRRLTELGFVHGLDEFRHRLRDVIHHPAEPEVRPSRNLLRQGMIERLWPQNLVG